jgi:hypothetical protein
MISFPDELSSCVQTGFKCVIYPPFFCFAFKHKVSLFKKGYCHLDNETYFGSYEEATRGNPGYFLTYGNGKSAARIQDHLRPDGAHRWNNYMKDPKYIKFYSVTSTLSSFAILYFVDFRFQWTNTLYFSF